MKKLYNEYFYVPKHEKVREKVVLTRISVAIALVVACLIAMSITAYAYFSHSVSSGYNKIMAANFEATVSLTDEDGNTVGLTHTKNNEYSAVLEADTAYSVTIRPGGTAKTGFCVVLADESNNTYHTQQLGRDENQADKRTESISFELKVTARSTVTFFAHYGTSSYYAAYENSEFYILDGDEVVIGIKGATPPTNETKPETENTETQEPSAEVMPETEKEDTTTNETPSAEPDKSETENETEPESTTDNGNEKDTETDVGTEDVPTGVNTTDESKADDAQTTDVENS